MMQFFLTDNSFDDAIEKLKEFILNLSTWLRVNKLVAHKDKTKLTYFGARPVAVLPVIQFNGVVLKWVSQIKYLSVILDNKLSFAPNIKLIFKKLSKTQGAIFAVRKLLPRSALIKLLFCINISPYY